MWDVATGREMASHPAGWLRAVVFDTPGKNLFLSGPRGLWRWPVHPASTSGSIRLGPPVALMPSSQFEQVGLSADGKILAVVATNRCYILHTDSTNEPARTETQTWMHYVAVHPAGTWIATGAWGKEGVKVWDGVTGRLCQELPSGDHTAVVFSPDGRWLVTGSETEYQFWNTGGWTRGLRIAHQSPTPVRDTACAMAFSPDGRSLVFSAEREGRVRLYVRRLDQLDAIPIAGTEGASSPFFSPDGQSLGFYADSALRKVPVGGGPVVELCKTDLVFGASWSHKDQIVFANARSGLWQVPAAGGTPAAVTKLQSDAGEVSHRLPQVLPDGETVLFTVTNTGFPSWDDTLVVAQSLTTGTRKVLIEGAADARFVSTGHLVYLRKGTLMAVPFDLRRLEVSGPAVGVVSDVMQAANIQPLLIDTGAGRFAVSNAGSLVYATGGVFSQDRWSLVWVDLAGQSEALRVPAGQYQAPRLSPNGRRVAFHSTMGDWDVWTYDVQRGSAARVPMEGQQSTPVWTPDGSRLAFSSSLKGADQFLDLLLIDPDGRSPAERLTTTRATAGGTVNSGRWAGAWTPDGRTLAFTGNIPRGIWVVSRDGKTEPRQLLSEGADPDFSADGRWLAYRSGSPSQVYVQAYPALDHRAQVSIEGGINPAWRRDGREMYYLQDASADGALKVRVMAVPVATTPTFSAGTPHMLFEGPFRMDGPFRNYDVTADGQRFLMNNITEEATSPITVILNWTAEVRR
jgi:serine/threonine-protein kinase